MFLAGLGIRTGQGRQNSSGRSVQMWAYKKGTGSDLQLDGVGDSFLLSIFFPSFFIDFGQLAFLFLVFLFSPLVAVCC